MTESVAIAKVPGKSVELYMSLLKRLLQVDLFPVSLSQVKTYRVPDMRKLKAFESKEPE